ncbi:hypothetical protein [Trinickia dinghuensis]|uniref:Lysine-specific metallo-endopeptidase domain-containing protein n=1 Tax=Trinickia dinghuensis TaxID=2291023 RepID=A0A3D8K582_9BURK|nr:hypothetical protein [Trinickia dinghuensis]RDV00479.1 hypothetical protein DWV00_01440 [Trinickia dinghuensis]
MAKTNIGAAFGTLVRNKLDDPGLALAARIACYLSHDITPARVRSIDSDLSFSIRSIGLRPTPGYSTEALINLRRASKLIHETRQSPPPHTPSPSNFDPVQHEAYIRRAKVASAAMPNRPGYYLASSYWAYSAHNDRVKTLSAWHEAAQLLAAGIGVAQSLNVPGNAQLFRRWFGTANALDVIGRLQRTRDGLVNQCTGLSYGGTAATGNPLDLKEGGFATDGGADRVGRLKEGEWGTAKAPRPYICLGVPFFNDSNTGGQPTRHHTYNSNGSMEVSRGGAIVHEATHLFARTDDVPLIDGLRGLIFAHLNAPPEERFRAAYGPWICYGLAQVRPDAAARNADNYRLFCEDAFVGRA